MDCKELNLNEDYGVGGSGGNCSKNGGDGFIDRSKVRILLCDNDPKSSEEVFNLLLKCSYQVISVSSARQVIDALNAEGPEIDIILAEVDLPMAKGMKMLKYIARDQELRRIPVIMMSTQDEVPIVVKCLRLGAADYLVKPLRTNELLNLWTHMWRRRRMLGLAEKNILNYEFDLVISDPSDANTTSTTLFSDDTNDKSSRSTNPEMGIATHQEDESDIDASVEPPAVQRRNHKPDIPGISDRRTAQLSSCPKKSELKIGESSAFFTYVKSRTVKNKAVDVEDNSKHSVLDHRETGQHLVHDSQIQGNGEAQESYSRGDDHQSSTSFLDSFSMDRSCTPPAVTEVPQEKRIGEERCSQVPMHPRNGSHLDISGLPAQTQTNSYPFFMPEGMMSSPAQLYQKNLQDMQNHAAMMSQYSHFHHCPPNISGMASYPPYYPLNVCLQPGQMPATHSWPPFGSSSNEANLNKVDRREAALIKFRQKRKERCFDKKIRYVNRKRLAERRPRVRGQFVRKVNGVNVDLNGQPASADDGEEEDEEDEQVSRDSSPEDDGLGY